VPDGCGPANCSTRTLAARRSPRGGDAQVDRAGADLGQAGEAFAEIVGARADHQRRRRRVRPRVGGGDEDRLGGAVGRRNAPKGRWRSAVHRPDSSISARALPTSRSAAARPPKASNFTCCAGPSPVDVDHHRDQRTALAAMDLLHVPAPAT